ncbi:MAG: inhibitor of cysteine peptidase [Actinomycetota bacterium]|nr:inhibitor of cysteine peptidase [Actinomycetota bacterium]
MNRLLAPTVTAALAAAFLATTLTGTAGAVPVSAGVGAVRPAAAPTSTTPAPTVPSKDRGVLVEVPHNTAASVALSRCFHVGTVFSVSLSENPSTGYGWSQSLPAAGSGPLTLLDSDYVQDPAPSGMVGVGGTRYFRYRVTAPGTTDVTFAYRRPWETGVAPIQQVKLTVLGR